MANVKQRRIAVLWRGDREARRAATPQNNRYHRIFEELAALGIHGTVLLKERARVACQAQIVRACSTL